ncbi:MAG TPA: 4Fe-4S dicluster-binding protein, partial [Thermoplasmata archaeon]|nr:4Fe-4S dicluster-binding protein [Thermoplasmata archaeon]
MAVVDPDKCTNCGKCESLCRFDAISTIEVDGRKRADIDIDSCEGCVVCARVCPEDAIGLRDRVVGEWFISDTNYGAMIHALLEPGAENSGKLVAMVKHKAKKTAKENGAELVLVDGPPGIGCPVIAALSGANIVVIVTEPTVSGLSDFRRVADLAGGFKIKCALLVNKADLNHEMTASLLEEATKREMPCIGEIPYDEGLMAAMAKGADAATEYQDCPAIIEISKTYDALLGLL